MHSIIGRRTPIISGDVAHTPSFELAFLTDTDDDREQARAALGNGVPVLLAHAARERDRQPVLRGHRLQRAADRAARRSSRRAGSWSPPPRSNGPTPTSTCRLAPITYAYVKTTFADLHDPRRPARQLRRRRRTTGRAATRPTSSPGPRATYESGHRPVPRHRCARRTWSASRCRLYFPGDPDPVDVPVEAGEVTIDRTAQARRRARIQIPWSLAAGIAAGLDMRALPLGRVRACSSAACDTRTARPSWCCSAGCGSRRSLGDARPGRRARAGRPHGPGPRRAVHGTVRRRRDAPRRRRDRHRPRRCSAPRSATTSRTTRPSPSPTSFYTGQRAEALTALEQSASGRKLLRRRRRFRVRLQGRPARRCGRSTPARTG